MTSGEEIQQVVSDGEGRLSLWPLGRVVPIGWTATGFEGERQACLDHVGAVWRDMRPLSIQERCHER